jgi:hypothetical protein
MGRPPACTCILASAGTIAAAVTGTVSVSSWRWPGIWQLGEAETAGRGSRLDAVAWPRLVPAAGSGSGVMVEWPSVSRPRKDCENKSVRGEEWRIELP